MYSNSGLTIEAIQELLRYVDIFLEEGISRKIIWALSNELGAKQAEQLAIQWGVHFVIGSEQVTSLCQYPDTRASLNYIVYLAQQNGYILPIDDLERFHKLRWSRKAGQVIYEDIFSNGISWATIGNELYQYSCSERYYIKQEDSLLTKLIADYLNFYQTKRGETSYATIKHTKEALQYVKARSFIDISKVNPAGINLANGYLKITSNDPNLSEFELIQHCSDNIFTYKSPVNYCLDADPSILNTVLNDILPLTAHQEILFRTLGASLNLPQVRKLQGRAVRALFLLGEGNNGKDTLREWVSLIYGGLGITSVPLQAFKTADKQQSFGLYPLISSKINWSSENDKVSIDTCQTLKNIVSGDEITIERKYEQGFSIRPQTIAIFNLNEMPAIETLQEAISSRYALLPFNSSFKRNPDPNKPWEKQADPRLKDDPDYIKGFILSAFLNKIIQGYIEVLSQGINYASVENLMQEVRESNSHLFSFVQETRLTECSYEEGTRSSEIYTEYEKWCIKEGLIKQNAYAKTYDDPNRFDSIIRNVRQLTKRLKKLFPQLSAKHTSQGSILPLCFENSGSQPNNQVIQEDAGYLFGE